MEFIRSVDRTSPPQSGTQPPTRPVPAPRTVTGTHSSQQMRMTSATSSVELGKQTASGANLP